MKAFLLSCLICSVYVYGCTDFVVSVADGSVIQGRSLEFPMDLQALVKVFPRKQQMVSQAPNKKKGISWVSQYGFLGVTGMGMNFSFEGINEQGLSFGYLWLPGITEYPSVSPDEMGKALDFIDMGAWVLGNFSTVEEVKIALQDVRVWGHPVPPLPGIPPVHAAIHDAEGNNLIVEFVGGAMQIYDNPIGVLTNSPAFDWQMANLSNYTNLNANAPKPVTQNGVTFTPPGQGCGFLGLPGDSSPPSRFVHIATYLRFVEQPANAIDGVNLAEHLLNSVDIPLGIVRDPKQGNDFTQWIVIKDLTHRIFYFRSYHDLTLKMIDMKQLDWERGTPGKAIPLTVAKGYVDMTSSLSK